MKFKEAKTTLKKYNEALNTFFKTTSDHAVSPFFRDLPKILESFDIIRIYSEDLGNIDPVNFNLILQKINEDNLKKTIYYFYDQEEDVYLLYIAQTQNEFTYKIKESIEIVGKKIIEEVKIDEEKHRERKRKRLKVDLIKAKTNVKKLEKELFWSEEEVGQDED